LYRNLIAKKCDLLVIHISTQPLHRLIHKSDISVGNSPCFNPALQQQLECLAAEVAPNPYIRERESSGLHPLASKDVVGESLPLSDLHELL
ncbi:hypothetical protein, partial [Aeromonas sobria]|uniref:hypothetical protein n=1 Tax=Aeromonas sobria TaxID=646 RepID=UPI001CA34E72